MVNTKDSKSNKSNKRHRQHKHWKSEEDIKLIALAIKYNKRKWKLVAAEMQTRDAKQCRERYFGHLDDGIDKHPLSKEEDALILKLRKNEAGWAKMASIISETFNLKRTANQIKNNYNQRLYKLEIEESQTFKTHKFFDSTEQIEFSKFSDKQFKPLDFSEKQHKTLQYELHELGKISYSGMNNITSQMKIVEKPKNRNNRISKKKTPKTPIVSNKMSLSYLMNSI